MKSLYLVFALFFTLSVSAQDDDMYFTPKKVEKEKAAPRRAVPERPPYYVGSSRDVDEYNRQGRFRSTYQTIATDSLGNDIFDFEPGNGEYPDSLYAAAPGYDSYDPDEDYGYSRRMNRFDDYWGWYDPWYGWGYPYWRTGWGWYDPWYWGWYDPWYCYGYGWGWPYYSYHYYHPWYYGGWAYYRWTRPVSYYRTGHTGTLAFYDRSNYSSGGRYVGNRNGSGLYSRNTANGSGVYGNTGFGTRRTSSTTGTYNQQNSFGNTRNNSYGSTFGGTRSSSVGSGSFGGGSGAAMGGSRGNAGGGTRMGGRR
ncbi:MAG: hypothetical protein ACI350_01550 [Prevotella sp.]